MNSEIVNYDRMERRRKQEERSRLINESKNIIYKRMEKLAAEGRDNLEDEEFKTLAEIEERLLEIMNKYN